LPTKVPRWLPNTAYATVPAPNSGPTPFTHRALSGRLRRERLKFQAGAGDQRGLVTVDYRDRSNQHRIRWSHGRIGSTAPGCLLQISTASDCASRILRGARTPASTSRPQIRGSTPSIVARRFMNPTSNSESRSWVLPCHPVAGRPGWAAQTRHRHPSGSDPPRRPVTDDQVPPDRVTHGAADARGQQQPTQLIDNNDPVGHPVEAAGIERHMRRCPASTVNAFSAASNSVDGQGEVDIDELPKEQCTTVTPGV
jgi:hypothetical protein